MSHRVCNLGLRSSGCGWRHGCLLQGFGLLCAADGFFPSSTVPGCTTLVCVCSGSGLCCVLAAVVVYLHGLLVLNFLAVGYV